MKTKLAVNIPSVILSCALLLATPLFAREDTDVVVMINGDHFTGEIKSLDAGVLYVSVTSVLGTSSIDWSKVARLESKQVFLVKTEDGSVYHGTLNTANTPGGRPVKIEVAETSGQAVVIDSSHIVRMSLTSRNFFQRFNGRINTGLIYTKGDESAQFSLGSEVAYPRKRWAAEASFNSNLSTNANAPNSTRNQLNFDAFRLLPWNNWFYEGVGDLLQSSEQGISRQTTYGGGIGRYLKNTNRARISVIAGLAGQNTEYEQNIASQNLTSVLIVAKLQFFRFNKTNGEVSTALLPVVSEPGRVKFNLNATYYIKITGDLSWNASFYGNWDNRSPGNLSGSDYGSSSGLSWTFGNR